ncbi:MAG: uroporphyrinogen-III synthase [Alphaproteobacteria bacterium]
MRLLITRPQEDAAPVAKLLRGRGFDVVIEPLLTIRYDTTAPVDLSDVQGVLITSANGVRALARATARRDVILLTVGGASARTAMDLGFGQVEDGGGDVGALAALAQERFDPQSSPLIHVAGTVTAGDLAGRLEAAGFSVQRRVLYDAQPASALSPALCKMLTGGEIDGVLLYSPRTAKLLVSLLTAAGLSEAARRITAFCLSQAVADALAPLQGMRVLVAATPDQEALLAVLQSTQWT